MPIFHLLVLIMGIVIAVKGKVTVLKGWVIEGPKARIMGAAFILAPILSGLLTGLFLGGAAGAAISVSLILAPYGLAVLTCIIIVVASSRR